MNDLGYPPDSERLRVGFAHAMELIAEGSASAVMVTAVLKNRKVKIWAAGDDEIRQKMEDVMRHVLYAPQNVKQSQNDTDNVSQYTRDDL